MQLPVVSVGPAGCDSRVIEDRREAGNRESGFGNRKGGGVAAAANAGRP